MRKLLIGAAAAASMVMVLPLLTAAPASAQVGIAAGEDGISVRIGRDRDRSYRGRYYDRRDWRDRDGWRRPRAECREVTVRRRLPDGSVVVRRSTRC